MKLQGLSDQAFRRIALTVKPDHLISLWYENDKGDKWFPPDDYNGYESPPKGFKYQWSRFPNMLREDCLEISESGSHQVMSGEISFQEDLVIAIVKSGDYDLSDAIIISATCCERCMNSLAEKYGLDWGYPEYSEEWEECNTECQFCEE